MNDLISSKVALKITAGKNNRVYRGFIPAVTEEELRTFGDAINSLQVGGLNESKKLVEEIYDIGGNLFG
jgi:predicted sugar kinase